MNKKESHTLIGGQELIGVHSRHDCVGEPCPIHNPTNHHMKTWEQNWRPDIRIIERICEHGIGHPDPDDINAKINKKHACDGCCTPRL